MRHDETKVEGEVVAFVLNAILGSIIVGLALTLTGCTLIAGPKAIAKGANGEWKVDFITGADFGAHVSGTDTLDNNIGMTPGGGFQRESARREKY